MGEGESYRATVRCARRRRLPWADAVAAMDLNGVKLFLGRADFVAPVPRYELREKGYRYVRYYGAQSKDQALLFIRLVWPPFRPKAKSPEEAYRYVATGFSKLDPRTRMAFMAGAGIRYASIDDVEG